MPRKLVRHGRVCGYRPTREQLDEILELAQRGIEGNSIASLRYSQGDEEIYSHGHNGKILSQDFSDLIKEAGDPAALNNLYFSISQDSPVRRVDIEMGPGDWTTYLIESDDQTWAYGRYHELTEKLLANRSLYAKGHFARPEILQESTGDKWRPAAWELVADWRVSIVKNLSRVLWLALAIEVAPILVALLYYYDPGGHTTVERNDQHNAERVLQWFNHKSTILLLITLSYVIMVIFLERRMRYFRRSKVILQSISSFSQLSLRQNPNDAVQLLILYLTFFILIVGVVTLLIQ